MGDFAGSRQNDQTKLTPVFMQYLCAEFAALPPTVQQVHAVYGPRLWTGRAKVTRGGSLWSRLLAAVFRFPRATHDILVTVAMTPKQGGELWERRFGESIFWSFLKVQNGKMTERFGPLTFTLGLHVTDGQLHFPVLAARLGPLPLPKFLLPESVAREYEADGRFHFDVALHAPLTGALMVHYQGWLVRTASCLGDGD